ncbi:PREDICTED: probable prolyl 4-hydroxylase 10 [Acropora digitifera]|uniref:probable prolyl 4-hydroxylase 10 n=1 Tax=Acropora digitifera TaxID=70779 RepID=UPI00077A037B|nr:PREDICTED: probable prolyl 4-hydroxylase 10 [Acropora digitifera]
MTKTVSRKPAKANGRTTNDAGTKRTAKSSKKRSSHFQEGNLPLKSIIGIGYKNHTDCLVNHGEKRDRFATILVYLRDVEEGGETKFPQLGISVKPRMGLALIWNSMNSKGECDPTSIHNAAKVVKGHKFIIQRW